MEPSRTRPQATPASRPVPSRPSPASSTSTAGCVEVSTALVARTSEPAREALRDCRWRYCTSKAERGYVFCPAHEDQWKADKNGHEPERDERQFVRYAYGDDCLLPYKPASLDPDPKPTKGYEQPPINKVLAALLAVSCDYRASSTDVDSWQAQCPAHEDSSPSLNVTRKHDAKVLLHCWAGCSTESVLYALGLEWRDLWDNSQHDAGRAEPYVKPLLEPRQRAALLEILRRDDERRAAA